jgi:RNA 3'-terminal phosphate cyclase (ATP)
VTAARKYLAADVPVGRHLADQLLVPMALGCAGEFTTPPLTQHTMTNIEVIRKFLAVRIGVEEVDEEQATHRNQTLFVLIPVRSSEILLAT